MSVREKEIQATDTTTATPNFNIILQRIAEVAAQQPNRVALHRGETDTTYGALWEQVGCASSALIESGATRGDLVALLLEPSQELVIWMLAVHRAGCAYLPVDTSWPATRISQIMEDSACRLIVTDSEFCNIDLSNDGYRLIDIRDTGKSHLPNEIGTVTTPDDIAYVIYTSGSTGRPKGVIVPQRALSNHCYGVIDAFELRSSDRVLQLASPSFDVAAEEIFPTLSVGATLVLRESLVVAPSALNDLSARKSLTVLNLPTSYWIEWVNWLHTTSNSVPPSVRLVIIGGEEVLPPAVQQWFRLDAKNVRLINAYGPTETTISPVLGDVTPADIANNQRVPIGAPLPNIDVTVVDEKGQPVGECVAGELVISGPCVAVGYLGQPEKTHEVFAGDNPARRSYRTGDIVRMRPDGKLEFIGRNDGQLQVRGYRIETGEIETRLLEHPAIKLAAVVCENAGTEAASLIGFVVIDTDRTPDVETIKRGLANVLPYYMVPNRIISVSALPTTTAGKIDRKRLLAEARPRQPFVAVEPKGPREEALSAIWQSVLQIDACDRLSSFIDHGGQSIMALEVIEKAAAIFETPPGLDSLLSDTLAQVAGGLSLRNGVIDTLHPAKTLLTAPARPVVTPLFIGDPEAPVYAVHYAPPIDVAVNIAVLICPPYAHEYVRTHRAITRLSESLASVGCHVLKFDYFGTGDSAGDSGAGSVDRWIDDIQTALAELRKRSGTEAAHIVGLRLGATLALVTPIEIESAVWIDPVLTGTSYVDALERLEVELLAASDWLGLSGEETDLVGIPWPETLRNDVRGIVVSDSRKVRVKRQNCVLSADFDDDDARELSRLPGEVAILRPEFDTPWKHLDDRAGELISSRVIAGINKLLVETH